MSTKKQIKGKKILNILEEIYPSVPIPLNHEDPFTLLVAVVLSAQCTDVRVNQVTPSLFREGGTPNKMAKLPLKKIEKIIRPCGLSPQKSKAIKNLSSLIVEKYNSKVPESFSELESLPGVGHKTASVVMSQAFNIPAFPIDTHIHRLAWRWGLSSGKNVIQTEKDLKKLFPIKFWNKLHLQIIYYGREYCKARECYGITCKICKTCYPNRRKPLITKKA